MNLDHSKATLLRALEEAGAKIKADGREIRCPFHDDKHASAGVYEDENGGWRFKCHGAECGFCGDVYDVTAKMRGVPVSEILREQGLTERERREPPRRQERTPPKRYPSIDAIVRIVPGELEARYTYLNPDTRKPDLIVLRYRQDGKKKFWQVSPNHDGWVLSRPEGLMPLYNRVQVRNSTLVVVCEGEKCAHALRAAGYCGTTSPMGAGKAHYADWSPLAGKTLYLWPDNDEGGIKHMEDVAGICERLQPVPTLYLIDPKGLNLPDKGDAADFVAGMDAEKAHAAIAAVLDTATPLGAARELSDMMELTISGQRRAITWPWKDVTDKTKALLPGTVTLFCGSPGSSKSFALLQALRHWQGLGVSAVVFELEEDRAYHLNRLLAQECESSDYVDPDWIREHGEEVRAAQQKHRKMLDAIGRMIYAAPSEQVDYKKLVEWTEARANEGTRIIVIDPVTAVAPERDVWIADSQFMFRIKTIAREKQTSIVLVTHPRKGQRKTCGMDDLAGGAAFQRFSQTLLWLESLPKAKDVTVRGTCGRYATKANRMLHLMKCRNGAGTGHIIAMQWHSQTLLISEQGQVLAEPRGKKRDDGTDESEWFGPRDPGMEG